MNGNMNLGKRVTLLEKDGGAEIKKEISDLQAVVAEAQEAITTAQGEITNLENKVNSGNVYSTEEKVVATWIDGRHVYERVVYGTDSSNDRTWVDTGIIIPNVDIFMTCEKGIKNPIEWDMFDDRVNALVTPSTGAVKVKQNISSSTVEFTFYVVLHYTKTTDNPTN